MNVPQTLCDAADVSAVTQLILKEREARDLGLWDEMRDCYHPDAQVRVSWFQGTAADFINRSIDMARRMPNRHRLSPVHVSLFRNRAVATLSAIVEIPTMLREIEMMLLIYARFVYRVEKREDEWRILSFDSIYLRDELTPCIPGQSISVDPHELQRFRPSYRLLSYVVSKYGYTIGSDLPGEDQAATVRALMDGTFAWARAIAD